MKSTRRDLGKVIRAVDEEIVTVFAAAYADVAANFEILFETLFPGGTGRLRADRSRMTSSTPASSSRPSRRART